MDPLERELRENFRTRTERFRHASLSVELLLPRAADELIDVSAFNEDERLPYWAELWPSARALARWLLERPPPPGPVLELGCGVALPLLALAGRGVETVATDYYPEALDFARVNARRNGLPAPRTHPVDWRTPPAGLGRFPTVLAADLLYEQRNADALEELLPRVVAPGGALLLADPGRAYAAGFRAAMEARGWRVEALEAREEPSAAGAVSRIRIDRLRAPAGDPQRGPPKA